MSHDYTYLFYYAIAYIIGSIPFGLLLAKFFAKVNLKAEGSGSIGATNVLRMVKKENPKLAKKLAAATMALDMLKAAIQILVYKFIFGLDNYVLWAIGVFTVIGHIYSLFLKFKGGKGVATTFGVAIVIRPVESILAILLWFIVGRLTKISSLASLIGVGSFFVISELLNSNGTLVPPALLFALILYKHIPNIKRMLMRKEDKISWE